MSKTKGRAEVVVALSAADVLRLMEEETVILERGSILLKLKIKNSFYTDTGSLDDILRLLEDAGADADDDADDADADDDDVEDPDDYEEDDDEEEEEEEEEEEGVDAGLGVVVGA